MKAYRYVNEWGQLRANWKDPNSPVEFLKDGVWVQTPYRVRECPNDVEVLRQLIVELGWLEPTK